MFFAIFLVFELGSVGKSDSICVILIVSGVYRFEERLNDIYMLVSLAKRSLFTGYYSLICGNPACAI